MFSLHLHYGRCSISGIYVYKNIRKYRRLYILRRLGFRKLKFPRSSKSSDPNYFN